MIIDEKMKKRILTFSDDKDIYKQFEQKCNYLSKLVGITINPVDYKLQYEIQEASMSDYIDIQTELYETLYKKYPQLDFALSGRLKSPFSYLEKVIKKYVDLIEKDEFKHVEVLDVYAMKIYVSSVNYIIDKVSVDSEGVYIDSGADEFRLIDEKTEKNPENKKMINDEEYIDPFSKDAFEFKINEEIITALVEEDQSNIIIENKIPYITFVRNKEKITLPLSEALRYKRSSKDDLIPFCYSISKDIEEFCNSKNFKTIKRKDYIARPKESGYSSNQYSFFSDESYLGLECQIRTADMEAFNNAERIFKYKPAEKELSLNALSRTPRFVLTTMFPDGAHSLALDEAECFKFVFGVSLQEYRKNMFQNITSKENKKVKKEDATR